MTKQELIDAIAAKTGGTKSVTGDVLDATIAAITAKVRRAAPSS